jgi:hypothetical protein
MKKRILNSVFAVALTFGAGAAALQAGSILEPVTAKKGCCEQQKPCCDEQKACCRK